MRSPMKCLVLIAAAAHLAAAPIAYSTQSFALAGDVQLPNPYVSRALDAVLLPIDAVVRTTFALDANDQGVLVLSVQPGGVADKQGIVPGDVIAQVKGHKIVNPIELDEVVYYWIQQGTYDFSFNYYRAGVIASAAAMITLELYSEVFDIASVASWQSWSYATSFSYAEFYSEYSEEITTSYESSETIIEETTSSEEFISEVTEEATSEETSDGDADGDGIGDAEDTDDDNDGTDDAADTDDDGDGTDDTAEPAEAGDSDADDDGVVDSDDTDDDNDGTDDASDTDDDNDGVDDADDTGDDADAGDDGDDSGGDDGDDSGGDDGGDDDGGEE